MSPEVRRRRRARGWRRIRRRAEDHPRVAAAIGAGVLLVLFGIWCGFRAWTVAHDLSSVARESEIMKAALLRGDASGARTALARMQAAAGRADSRTGGPTWAVLEHVPVFGDDARGIATVSSVLDDLGRRGLPPVIGAAQQVTGDSFQPQGHRFPLARIAALQGPARTSEQAFADAAARLDEVDSSGFVGPFRARFDELRGLVGVARSSLGSAYRAAQMMPSLLGSDGPRYYLLVLENNAELRSLGGLAGSVSLVRADHGTVHIVQQDDVAHLEGVQNVPSLRLRPDEKRLFGPLLKQAAVDATMTPDAVRASEMVRARWERVEGRRVDGVFFVDPVAVSYLLQGLGPVAVPPYPPVASWNVVQAVENQIYLSTPDVNLQSDYQNAVAKAVFNVFADGHGDPVTAIRGLARGVEEGRIRMHSFVPQDQRSIAGTAIAGEFPTTPTVHPQAGVYVNDSTESKMSYYLQYSVSVASRSCGGGIQDGVGDLTLTSRTPPNLSDLPASVTGVGDPVRGIAKGQQYVVVYLTSPIDGAISSLTIDGRTLRDPAVVSFARRQVAGVGVNLDPGSTHSVSWVMRSGIRQSGSWQVSVTPGSEPGTQSRTVPSAC